MATHVILGANGAVGREVAGALRARGHAVRQASRSPRPEAPSDVCVAADLRTAEGAARAVAGADVAYLVAGLPYRADVWRRDWPLLMTHVLAACGQHGVRLVFFDNVYAYGRVEGAMTEATPFNPCSHKGETRARIARQFLEAVGNGSVTGMIVRSPDFYDPAGAGRTPSFLNAVLFERLLAGRVPQWMGDPDQPHTFAYTPDLGRALVHLAEQDAAWGRSWHAPVDPTPHTGREFVRLAAALAGRPDALRNATRWLLRGMGLFDRALHEQLEVLYQFEAPYTFSSEAVRTRFGLEGTPYAQGFRAALVNS
jgi:nucleoside-diphosphate-sugar epimerase